MGEDHIHMARLGVVAALAVAAMLCVAVHAEVFFQEDFTDGWEDRWVKSKFKSGDEGPWELSAGKFYGDADNKGLKTMTDYRWYDISAKTPTFSNKGKTLVIQYTVKHEQSLDCGGGYIKLAPTSDQDKNHLIKREIKPETDELTHIYTLIVKPDNTYEVQIDLKKVQSGSPVEDWDMLPPMKIKDPKVTKPPHDEWDE